MKTLTFIEQAVTKGLPLLSADESDRVIIKLTIENMKLKAALDALNWDWKEKR